LPSVDESADGVSSTVVNFVNSGQISNESCPIDAENVPAGTPLRALTGEVLVDEVDVLVDEFLLHFVLELVGVAEIGDFVRRVRT